MRTIEDIQFDRDYSQARTRFLLLYDDHRSQHGPSIFIELPYVSALTFVNTFSNLHRCQEYIRGDPQRKVILFTTNQKLRDWDSSIPNTDRNLQELSIFCDTFSELSKMQQWNGCYHEKIKKVFMYDKLCYELLYSGLGYVKAVSDEFREDRGLRTKILGDARRITKALEHYFEHQLDMMNEPISEECRS